MASLLGRNSEAFALELGRGGLIGLGSIDFLAASAARQLGVGSVAFHDERQTRGRRMQFRPLAAPNALAKLLQASAFGGFRGLGLTTPSDEARIIEIIVLDEGGAGCGRTLVCRFVTSLERRHWRARSSTVGTAEDCDDEKTRSHWKPLISCCFNGAFCVRFRQIGHARLPRALRLPTLR